MRGSMDLDAIWDYLSIECGSTSAAIKATDSSGAMCSRIRFYSHAISRDEPSMSSMRARALFTLK